MRKIDLNKLQTKAAGDDSTVKLEESGVFSGYASAFGVKDSYGDIIHKGAFSDSIAKYKESGRKFPLLLQHNQSDVIGVIDTIEEDDYGLKVTGTIMHDLSDTAKTAYNFTKAGAISEMSVGMWFVDGGGMWDDETNTYNIFRVDLKEVSLVVVGANYGSVIESIKSAGEPATVAPEPTIDLTEAFAILSRVTDSQTKTALDQLASVINRLEV